MEREEAIKVIKKNYPHVGFSGSQFESALRELIPELRESEDEIIRNRLINLIRELASASVPIMTSGYFIDGQDKKYIAYLEKQKVNTEGDFGRGYDCGYQAGYAVAKNEMKPKVATATLDSEKRKEQKPAEWSEEDKRILKGIIGKINQDQTYGVAKVEMLSFLKSIRPSWKPSEEQMKALYKAAQEAAIDREDGNALYQLYEQLNQLKQ